MTENTIKKNQQTSSESKTGGSMSYTRCARILSTSIAVLIGAALVGVTPVSAQGITPQQGNVQGKIADQNRMRLEQQDAAASVKQTGPGVVTDPFNRRDLPPRGGPTVLLHSVTIGPSSVFLSEAELKAIAMKYRGQRVDFSQISELVRDVNDLYAEKGIVTAAAVLPPQNLNAGNLQIRLVEGQLGSVALVGDHKSKNDFIFNRITLAKGTTVDVPTAAKDIERFNATNRAQLRLLLQPGAAFGYTDLVLGITEPAVNELQFYIDNEGVTSTGQPQFSALYRRYGLLGVDDTLMAYLSKSAGSSSITARYEFPIGTYGTRLAASVTGSKISVISGPTNVLNITGGSTSVSLSLSHPIFINDKWTILGTASVFSGTSYSKSSGVPLVDSETVKYAPGVTLSYRADKGSVSTQIQGVFAETTDNLATTKRDAFLLTGSVNGQYHFANGLTLVGTGAWQYSKEKLLPGNLLFQIGGPTTVRGYPSDGIAGDSGFYGSFELHKQFNVRKRPLDGYVFADFGEVYSTFPRHTTLVSAGFGVNYTINKNIKASLSVATPLKQSLSNQSEAVITGLLTIVAF